MRFLSLFSGIEACSMAWEPLGWVPVAFCEFAKFPSEVLLYHYPHVPNLHDVTKVDERVLERLGPIDIVVGGSPCFPANVRVLTSSGYTPISDIKVGDLVLTHKGRWRKVLQTGGKISDTISLKGHGHYGLETTSNHPFWSIEKKRVWNNDERKYDYFLTDPIWTDASEMLLKFWATPTKVEPLPIPQMKYELNTTAQVPEMNEDFWWVVGRYLGDGWTRSGKRSDRKHQNRHWHQIFICCSHDERDELKTKLDLIGMNWASLKERTVVKFRTNNKALHIWLLENFGQYAYGKRLPSFVFGMPESHRRSLLEGYLSADGWTKESIGLNVISTISHELALGFRLLAETLGYTSSLYTHNRPKTCVIEGRTVNQKNPYIVKWKIPDDRSRLIKLDDISWNRVKNVSSCNKNVQVYNLEVEEDNTYVAEGIIVHNCQNLSTAGKRTGLKGEASSLFYEQIRIFQLARRINGARFLLWENVVGAFATNSGRDFSQVVAEMAGLEHVETPKEGWKSEGAAIGHNGLLEWCVLDAQWNGLAQRRKRVFAVLDTGDWSDRPPILLEPKELRKDSPPSRKSKSENSGSIEKDSGKLSDTMWGIGSSGVSEHNASVGEIFSPTLISQYSHTVAFSINSKAHQYQTNFGKFDIDFNESVAPTHISARCDLIAYNNDKVYSIPIVRNFTPRECERLMGFPDDYTLIELAGKPASDNKRYFVLGNSMAVPTMKWIGESIDRAVKGIVLEPEPDEETYQLI